MNGIESEEIVKSKCANCSKDIYVFRDSTREKMFCTLKCLEEHGRNMTLSTQ